MKKLFAFLFCGFLVLSVLVMPVSAVEAGDILISSSVEILENGDCIITEVYENAVQPRSERTGYGKATYYNAGGTAIWDVTVKGTFTYNGTTSSATSATATVNLYSNNATFISKSAGTSGNSATATATVRYNAVQVTRTARVSCDKNGNLY